MSPPGLAESRATEKGYRITGYLGFLCFTLLITSHYYAGLHSCLSQYSGNASRPTGNGSGTEIVARRGSLELRTRDEQSRLPVTCRGYTLARSPSLLGMRLCLSSRYFTNLTLSRDNLILHYVGDFLELEYLKDWVTACTASVSRKCGVLPAPRSLLRTFPACKFYSAFDPHLRICFGDNTRLLFLSVKGLRLTRKQSLHLLYTLKFYATRLQ